MVTFGYCPRCEQPVKDLAKAIITSSGRFHAHCWDLERDEMNKRLFGDKP